MYLHPRRQLTPIAGKKVKARREGSNQKQGYHFGNKRLQDRDLATICSRENIKLILSHCYGSKSMNVCTMFTSLKKVLANTDLRRKKVFPFCFVQNTKTLFTSLCPRAASIT